MVATVETIYRLIDEIAPFETQETWDNAGLLAGRMDREVRNILVALDMTRGAITEAVRRDCQLIVTHHPILFHARKNLREDDPEGQVLCALVRANLAHIAAHTNFDAAPGGVSDVLGEQIGLTNVQALDEGLRAGDWRGTLGELADAAGRALGGVMRVYGPKEQTLYRVAVCGGAGGSLWRIAYDAGCDGYLTGEIHHNDALDAAAFGMGLVEGGHYATEHPAVKQLRNALQIKLDALQYNVMVLESAYKPF